MTSGDARAPLHSALHEWLIVEVFDEISCSKKGFDSQPLQTTPLIAKAATVDASVAPGSLDSYLPLLQTFLSSPGNGKEAVPKRVQALGHTSALSHILTSSLVC